MLVLSSSRCNSSYSFLYFRVHDSADFVEEVDYGRLDWKDVVIQCCGWPDFYTLIMYRHKLGIRKGLFWYYFISFVFIGFIGNVYIVIGFRHFLGYRRHWEKTRTLLLTLRRLSVRLTLAFIWCTCFCTVEIFADKLCISYNIKICTKQPCIRSMYETSVLRVWLAILRRFDLFLLNLAQFPKRLSSQSSFLNHIKKS